MAQVFISYKREEMPIARQVRLALKAAGYSVWWDEEVQGGQRWAEEIDDALAQARVVVVLWSSRSTASDWVKQEASAGKLRKRLVPVRIDDCELPPAFAAVQAIDLRQWDGDEKARRFVELRRAVASVLWRQRLALAGVVFLALVLVGGAALSGWALSPTNQCTTAPATAAPDRSAARAPDSDPRDEREYRILQDERTFAEGEGLRQEVFTVPRESEYVLKGYSVAGAVDVEMLVASGNRETSILQLGQSEGAGFNEGHGHVWPAGAKVALRSLTGAGVYRYKFSGYLRPAR